MSIWVTRSWLPARMTTVECCPLHAALPASLEGSQQLGEAMWKRNFWVWAWTHICVHACVWVCMCLCVWRQLWITITFIEKPRRSFLASLAASSPVDLSRALSSSFASKYPTHLGSWPLCYFCWLLLCSSLKGFVPWDSTLSHLFFSCSMASVLSRIVTPEDVHTLTPESVNIWKRDFADMIKGKILR